MPVSNKRQGLVLLSWSLIAPALMLSGVPSRGDLRPHPVLLPADIDPSKCVGCHTDKATGKYVHAAISMGCMVCHSIATVKGTTYITLSSPPAQLCFTCHTLSTDRDLHPPYQEGHCVFCHSPHTSNFPAQLYASPQEVCMACHVRGLMKVDRKARTFTLPWGTTFPFKDMSSWVYLDLDRTHEFNHPVLGHPVSGPNVTLGKDVPPITCLTCHDAHHSTVANLIPPKYKNTTGLCLDCHGNL